MAWRRFGNNRPILGASRIIVDKKKQSLNMMEPNSAIVLEWLLTAKKGWPFDQAQIFTACFFIASNGY